MRKRTDALPTETPAQALKLPRCVPIAVSIFPSPMLPDEKHASTPPSVQGLPRSAAYVLAVLLVAAAALVRWAFSSVLASVSFLTFYPAVVAAAFGGMGPGLVATLASALMYLVWFDVDAVDPLHLARVAIFASGGAGVSFLAWLQRRAQAKERHKSEELLRLEKRFRLIVEAVPDHVIFILDPEGRVVTWNAGAARIKGNAAEEIIGQHFSRFFPPEDVAAGIPQRVLHVAAEQGRSSQEGWRVRKDGSRFWALSMVTALRNDAGAVTGFAEISRDMTERRAAEEMLRQSERRFRELADAMPQMVWATRPDGYHEYFNRRWYELTGAREDESVGHAWIQIVHPDDRDRCLQVWHASLRTGTPYQIEYRFKCTGSESEDYRWYLGRALPVQDDSGVITRWYGTRTDIHDLKRAQQELAAAQRSAEQAKAAAEEASKAKDHFLAVLSHELRTPLTPVMTAVSMLQQRANAEDSTYDTLEMIRRNVELEARLIDDLLDVTRIARGKIELDRRPVELLTLEGHNVQVAGDVAGALALVDQQPFDLLLSDLGLPDGSGLDLMRQLRRRGHALPGIALTGYGQEEDIQRSRAAGFAAHLTKPPTPERLLEHIGVVMAQRSVAVQLG